MTDMRTLISDQFSQLGSHVRIVVMHPNCSQQHRVLSLLGADYGYVRLNGHLLGAEETWLQVQAAWNLSRIDARSTLVIDESDRARDDGLATLMVEKLLPLVKQGRIILMGRQTPAAVLNHPQLRDKTALLPVDDDHMLMDYRALPAGRHLLEVWGLGSGRVMIDGRQVDSWDGVLPRALFFYLVDRGMATRSEIFENFWPVLNVREATNVFHVTKRKVSEVLGTDLTQFKASYYYLAPAIQLQYDVSRFNYCVQESAHAQPAEAEQMLREAVSLVRGTFIGTLNVPWAQRRRAELGIAYTDALFALGRLVEGRGDAAEGLSWYIRAFRQNPARADVTERLLQLFRHSGRILEGKEVYRKHQSALETEEYKKVSEGVRRAAAALG